MQARSDPMQTVSCELRFATPAFVGNAEQSGQWRTPPFKALLRQWWRVAVAHELEFDANELRQCEGKLFGTAADESSSRQSKVRMRLDTWQKGKRTAWPEIGRVHHPEARKGAGGMQISSALYLGYGPLQSGGPSGTQLKEAPAIDHGESAKLRLAFPREHEPELLTALALIDHYGALGGRSRNGWGSLSLEVQSGAALPKIQPDSPWVRDWRDALGLDWPHAIGKDGQGPLIWQTEPQRSWERLVEKLARIKIGLRTDFPFKGGNNVLQPEERHWLSYPVTSHRVTPWGDSRLPNSLRFKVRPAPDKPDEMVGVIFHMPCQPPPEFRPDLRTIETVWRQAHAFLDEPAQQLTRIPA